MHANIDTAGEYESKFEGFWLSGAMVLPLLAEMIVQMPTPLKDSLLQATTTTACLSIFTGISFLYSIAPLAVFAPLIALVFLVHHLLEAVSARSSKQSKAYKVDRVRRGAVHVDAGRLKSGSASPPHTDRLHCDVSVKMDLEGGSPGLIEDPKTPRWHDNVGWSADSAGMEDPLQDVLANWEQQAWSEDEALPLHESDDEENSASGDEAASDDVSHDNFGSEDEECRASTLHDSVKERDKGNTDLWDACDSSSDYSDDLCQRQEEGRTRSGLSEEVNFSEPGGRQAASDDGVSEDSFDAVCLEDVEDDRDK